MRGRALALPLVLLALLAPVAPAAGNGTLKLSFLDVGHGDSILIVTPDGKSALIDAGRDPTLAASLVRLRGVTKLDLAVATHADPDHIGGLAEVARRFRPAQFLNNGIAHATTTYQQMVYAFAAVGSRSIVASDRTIELGDQVELRVLAPVQGLVSNYQNANSVGILLTFGKFRAFFGGDAEPQTTSAWASTYAKNLAGVTVHKALEHGHTRTETASFLNLLRPKEVVVSVGARNPYGLPSSTTLLRYKKLGAKVYRTDLNGTITFTASPDGSYTVGATRGLGTDKGKDAAAK